MPGLSEHDFYTAPGGVHIVMVLANVAIGQEMVDQDAPIRHVVHRVIAPTPGVQVELRTNPPVPIPGDRPVQLDIPLLTQAQATALRGIRTGVYGIPVTWLSNLIPGGLPVIMVDCDVKAHAGAQKFFAKVTLQPL